MNLIRRLLLFTAFVLTQPAFATNTPLRVLLLGDSCVSAQAPREVLPHADQFEDVIRKLVSPQPDLLPIEVINKGYGGETIQGLLSNRYDKTVAKIPGGAIDYIFIRYGLNDINDPTWTNSFPAAYHQLIAQLRRDHPSALITLETVIPYTYENLTQQLNDTIRAVASAEKLPVLDTHAAFAEAMRRDPVGLRYRVIRSEKVPPNLRPLLPPNCEHGGFVYLLDNTLDAHFRNVPDWEINRHPNLAGYHVIAQAIADYLAPLLRQRRALTERSMTP